MINKLVKYLKINQTFFHELDIFCTLVQTYIYKLIYILVNQGSI